MTQFRENFSLMAILEPAFREPNGALHSTLPDDVLASWSWAASELGLPIDQAQKHPWFISKARGYFCLHEPPTGPGSTYDFPRNTVRQVWEAVTRAVQDTGRGYSLGDNIKAAGARVKTTSISIELPDETAPYLYGLKYRHAHRGSADKLEFQLFDKPLDLGYFGHIAGDCRSDRIIVSDDFEVILARYINYMAVIDGYVESYLK